MFAALALLPIAIQPAPLPTPEALVEKFHAPRAALTQYELVIDSRQVRGGPRPQVRHIWRDQDQYRVDVLVDFTDGRPARNVDCDNCPERGQFFTVWYDATPNLSQAATMSALTSRHQIIADLRLRVEDLGGTVEPTANLTLRGLDWFLGNSKWTEKHVERVDWKGRPALRLALGAPNDPSKATFSVTFLPDRGFAVVEARSTGERGGVPTVHLVESEVAERDGVWLPTTCSFTKHVAGQLTEAVTEQIEYVSIGRPIDRKAFTLAGMDLIPGTLVSTPKGYFRWEDSKLGPATNLVARDPDIPLVENQRSGSRRILLVAVAVAAGLACAFLAVRLVSSVRKGRGENPRQLNPEHR